jgi:hypothetical protein
MIFLKDPRFVLDQYLPKDTPVLILEETSHSSWVNSEALRRAGITKDTPDPPGIGCPKKLYGWVLCIIARNSVPFLSPPGTGTELRTITI